MKVSGERTASAGNKSVVRRALSRGLVVFLAVGGALLVLQTWREDRLAFVRVLAEVRDSLEILQHRLDAQEIERASTLRVWEGLRQRLDDLKATTERLAARPDPQAASAEAIPVQATASVEGDSAVADDLQVAGLPEIPEGLNAQIAFRKLSDVADLLREERWNPEGKEIDELTLAELRVQFARARGQFEVLEAEMYQELTLARADLSECSEYIDYAPGEKYITQPGTLTSAQRLPGGGVRIFYFSPAEFPELYAKRRERNAKAEQFLRRMLKTIEEQ